MITLSNLNNCKESKGENNIKDVNSELSEHENGKLPFSTDSCNDNNASNCMSCKGVKAATDKSLVVSSPESAADKDDATTSNDDTSKAGEDAMSIETNHSCVKAKIATIDKSTDVVPGKLGPGAEVKGKIGTPIPSGSKCGSLPQLPGANLSPTADIEDKSLGTSGGRLTFFKDGKFLLELSHRMESGSSSGWIAVKSKTYWPPSSTTAAATIHHPLRHDTPTSHSDDCSSMNSSPWAGERTRKQPLPKHCSSLIVDGFVYFVSAKLRSVCKKVRLRRNPFGEIKLTQYNKTADKLLQKCQTKNRTFNDQKRNLERKIKCLVENCNSHCEMTPSVERLQEKPVLVESNESLFVSPRKRYLRQVDDVDSQSRKRLQPGINSLSSVLSERCSSSPVGPIKSAIQSSNTYSIDSLLNSDSISKKSDSYLRNLLRPDTKVSSSSSSSSSKSSSFNKESHIDAKCASKTEKDQIEYTSGSLKDYKVPSLDISKLYAEHTADLGLYSSAGAIPGLSHYLGLNPHYVMPHLLPGLVPPVSSPEVTAMAAAAAAAASINPYTFPLSPLHYSSLIASGALASVYPSTTLSPQLMQSPNPSPSPFSSVQSPSRTPKPAQTQSVSNTPGSPQLGLFGHGASSWQLSSGYSSSNSNVASPAQSPPPPQDAPLNLSKPRNK